MILLKKKLGDTIYQKIFSLIIVSSAFFLTLFFAVLYYMSQQKSEVYSKTRNQFDNEINSLIELNAHTNVSNIVDIVYWDEFQKYLVTKDSKWFEQNIVTSLETYGSDFLGIYDINGKFVRKHSNDKIKSIDFIPKPVLKRLNKEKILKFYLQIPEGIAEVYGATIHPSSDITKRITKHSGYFFIVRLYDQTYLKSLEAINNSKIGFDNVVPMHSEDRVVISKELPGWDGLTLRKLYFERQFDVSFRTMEIILYILIVTFLINVIISLIYSYKWVYKPLKLIMNILENVNEKDMCSLKDVPGEFRHISYLFKENDEQKKLLEYSKAKAEESDKLKSSFLTNISHEIRTPINAIVGFSDLLINEKLSDDERCEYTRIIKHSGSNLVSIIDDLIEMSKIDTNQVTPNFTLINLDTVLDDLYKTIKIAIPEEKNIQFLIIPPTNQISRSIVTDDIKLRQILTNLITNSIKYTEKGFVAFGYDYGDDGELFFTIKDSGIGIDKEHQALIFDRFHRVDNQYTIKAGGLGLGLAISKAYVQMLGGDISLKSSSEGTTFKFTIKANLTSTSIPKLGKLPRNATVEISMPITILVAEDNNINFLLLQKILTTKLHTILHARDGAEAVEQCRNNPNIDLVLMDIKMPVLDGYEAFERIKVFRPDLPVIAQTAFSSSEDQQKIMMTGFHGYLSKPINKEKLICLVDEVVKFKKEIQCIK